ncbi:MAG: GGDEF domain-containing protein [Rehaibacterium terrae]|uniref:GGDEF domain-containing protein n=1 Tax=Rehaibacterium terrae TaxID=1341696 RepID=UPI00391AB85B
MLERLRGDFHLTIITLFGLIAVIAIVPFGAYRFLRGQWLAGVVDTALVGVIATTVVLAWRSGHTRLAGIVIALINSTGCALIAHLLGHVGMMWAYVVLLSNFLLTTQRLAFLINVGLIAVLLLQPELFLDPGECWSFLATAGLVSLFALIYAHRAESQHRQLEALATHDPLTGLPNRRLMEIELAEAQRRRRTEARPAALLVLDLDHFKRVNDQLGHEAGDQVLRDFAALVQSVLRKRDRLYRFGGEEFVLLLPGTDAEGLRAASQKLLQCVRDGLRCALAPVTVSMGGASLLPDEPWMDCLARADAAMYLAKQQGRDRCVIATDTPLDETSRRQVHETA